MSLFIQNEFNKVKRKYNLTSSRGLIKQAGIKLLELPLDDNTGGLTVTNNRCSTIIINCNWEEHYQEFVILHEFSHLRLHGWASTPFYRKMGTGNFVVPKIEREANELAIDILAAMQDQDIIHNLTKNQLAYYLGVEPYLIDYLSIYKDAECTL